MELFIIRIIYYSQSPWETEQAISETSQNKCNDQNCKFYDIISKATFLNIIDIDKNKYTVYF